MPRSARIDGPGGIAKLMRRQGMDWVNGDQCILGDSTFVLSIIEQIDQALERSYALKQKGLDLEKTAEKVARLFNIETDGIFMKSRGQVRADARGLFCNWAVSELGFGLSALGQKLNTTPLGAGYVVQRVETIAQTGGYGIMK